MELRIYKQGSVLQTIQGQAGVTSLATMKQAAKRRIRDLAKFGDWVHLEIVDDNQMVKGRVRGYRLAWETAVPL